MILDLKKGHLKFKIISFLDHFWNSKIFFAFGSFASLLSVLWLKTRKNNKKMFIELQCDLDMILDQFLSSDLGYDLKSK
jgi:hypothetical protein